MAKPERLRRLGLLLLRATYDTVRWMRRHRSGEALSMLLTAAVSLVAASFLGETAWKSAAIGLVTGFATLALLWLVVFLYHLAKAPSALRSREVDARRGDGHWPGMPPGVTPILTLDIAIRLNGAESSLRYQALQLAVKIRKLYEISESGGMDELVVSEHRRVLDDIERFGVSAADADLEQETERGRLRALALYEEIRGFPLRADLSLIAERLQLYATPPDSRFARARLAIQRRIRELYRRVS